MASNFLYFTRAIILFAFGAISACSHVDKSAPKNANSWAVTIGPKDIDALMANGDVIIISTRALEEVFSSNEICEIAALKYERNHPIADHMEVKCTSPHPNKALG